MAGVSAREPALGMSDGGRTAATGEIRALEGNCTRIHQGEGGRREREHIHVHIRDESLGRDCSQKCGQS